MQSKTDQNKVLQPANPHVNQNQQWDVILIYDFQIQHLWFKLSPINNLAKSQRVN